MGVSDTKSPALGRRFSWLIRNELGWARIIEWLLPSNNRPSVLCLAIAR